MPPLYHVRRQKSTSFAGAKKIRGNAEIGGKIACFFCADFYNSATEKSAVTTLAGVTELAGRVLASLVFAKLWGFTGICSSNPVAWVAAVVFLVTVYYVTMRRRDAAPRARVRRLPA